jgi:heptaprenyl diphosphate synthase
VLEGIKGLPILAEIEDRLQDLASRQCGDFREMASHLVQAGGKRLRPLLVVLSHGVLPDQGETGKQRAALVDVAVAAELIHTASLIHDDILDCAETRRGRPAVNTVWGEHAAVLTGDYLFALSFNLLSGQQTSVVLKVMVQAIRALCEGELEETATLFDPTVSASDYLQRVEKKTASLLSACCAAGGQISGASPATVTALSEYGRNLGIAFQIIDDLLDFTADEQALGKPAGSDLTGGVITMPVIFLLKNSNYRDDVSQMIREQRFTGEDLTYLRRALHQSSALEDTYRQARCYAEKAREYLAVLPSQNMRRSLMKLDDQVTSRLN